jgi:hypothetical protein
LCTSGSHRLIATKFLFDRHMRIHRALRHRSLRPSPERCLRFPDRPGSARWDGTSMRSPSANLSKMPSTRKPFDVGCVVNPRGGVALVARAWVASFPLLACRHSPSIRGYVSRSVSSHDTTVAAGHTAVRAGRSVAQDAEWAGAPLQERSQTLSRPSRLGSEPTRPGRTQRPVTSSVLTTPVPGRSNAKRQKTARSVTATIHSILAADSACKP